MVVKCDQLIFKPTNPLTFQVSGGTRVLTAHKVDGIIQALEGPSGLNLTLGLSVDVKKINYKINIIEEVWRNDVLTYDLSVSKRTKASFFILPMLGGKKSHYFWNQLFMNCFIATPEEKNCIALLYRFSADPLFLKFEKAVTKFRWFKRREDPSDGYVLFIFNVPPAYEQDYEKIINGKYSEISKKYKIDLLEFHNTQIDSLIGEVLFKSERRRLQLEKDLGAILPENSELLSIIDPEQETFNIKTYIK